MEFTITRPKTETVSVQQIMSEAGITGITLPYIKNNNNYALENGKKCVAKIFEGKIRDDGSHSILCGNVQVHFGHHIIMEIQLNCWEGGSSQSNRLKTSFRLSKPTETVKKGSATFRNNLRPYGVKGNWVGIGNTRQGKASSDGMPGRLFASTFLSDEVFQAIEHYVDETLYQDAPVLKSRSEMTNTMQSQEQETEGNL